MEERAKLLLNSTVNPTVSKISNEFYKREIKALAKLRSDDKTESPSFAEGLPDPTEMDRILEGDQRHGQRLETLIVIYQRNVITPRREAYRNLMKKSPWPFATYGLTGRWLRTECHVQLLSAYLKTLRFGLKLITWARTL